MSEVRLILALHNHQPVGNFEGVFEASYRDAYAPFLEVLEAYPEIPIVLHISGPLLEWLVGNRPEYIERLRRLIETGRLEILGGAFYEPILAMIPPGDRVGQIREYSAYLREIFGRPVRGMWIAERVWEQSLASSLVDAGIEYTILDDFHFERAGLEKNELLGYYLTEDDGRLLKVFTGSERLRYDIPFQEPHAVYEYLRGLSVEHPGAVAVMADDGEKFGGWPSTFDHVFTRGWLRRFFDMLVANRDWIETTTFSRVVDTTLPLGKLYLPDGSYREMTEWSLPTRRFAAYKTASESLARAGDGERFRPFLQGGGSWRNFKAKYPESDEMYARMLGVSRRLARAGENPNADRQDLETARKELYRGQCNCPYWHGSFGGLYLPHLRQAIYSSLIAADSALDRAEGKIGPRVELEVGDFNLDARREVRIENDRLVGFVRPARGGHLYELDDRRSGVNLLATLERRREPYHTAIVPGAGKSGDDGDGVKIKQDGLDRLLVFDGSPRKALVDHFPAMEATLDDLIHCRDVERGDFVSGAYLSKYRRGDRRVSLIMERPGLAEGRPIRIVKTIHLDAGRPTIEVEYVLEDLPEGVPLQFAVEFNLAGMAARADDRFYSGPLGERLGSLDAKLDLHDQDGIRLTDEWLDLSVALHWSRSAGLWCFPVETVSQSEGGVEGVYQGSAVIPHWIVAGDASGRWDLKISWTVDRVRSPAVEDRRAGDRDREPASVFEAAAGSVD